MPGGGKLTIRLEIGDDHTVAIYFTDNGSGIPEAILSVWGTVLHDEGEREWPGIHDQQK